MCAKPLITSMHIVVAVNESEPSLFAFDWMIENILKDSKNHKLSILTVVEPPVQAGYYYAASGGKKVGENKIEFFNISLF
jgi:hypothetical protein